MSDNTLKKNREIFATEIDNSIIDFIGEDSFG